MTITVLPARNEYTATSGQTVFNYTFKIFENTDLNVYITPAGQEANDSTDLTTAYTVDANTIGDEDGGFITMDSGVTAGYLVTIVSDVPESRTTDYQFNGDFIPDTVNDDFDRVVQLTKQVEDTASRTLTFEQSQQNASSLSLPPPAATLYLRWRPDELGLENVDLTTFGTPTDSSIITYTPPFTGSQPTTVETKLSERVSVLDFGATGNGINDDTAAVQAAINHVASQGGGSLAAPEGTYLVADLEPKSYVLIKGEGRFKSIFKGGAGTDVFSSTANIRGFGFESLGVVAGATTRDLIHLETNGALAVFRDVYLLEGARHNLYYDGRRLAAIGDVGFYPESTTTQGGRWLDLDNILSLGSGDDGIHLLECSGPRIRNVISSLAGGAGIHAIDCAELFMDHYLSWVCNNNLIIDSGQSHNLNHIKCDLAEQHGVILKGTATLNASNLSRSTFTDLEILGASQETDNTYDALHIDVSAGDVLNIRIDGFSTYPHPTNPNKHRYGVGFTSGTGSWADFTVFCEELLGEQTSEFNFPAGSTSISAIRMSPTALAQPGLEVYGSSSSAMVATDLDDAVSVKMQASSSGGQVTTQTNHALLLGTNNAEKWRVQGGGNFVPATNGGTDIGQNGGFVGRSFTEVLALKDGITAPGNIAGSAGMYVDAADGDLKIRFSDGTVKTIVTDS